MRKLILTILFVMMATPAAYAGDYYRYRYPDLYPPRYYAPYPYYASPPPAYVPPPQVYVPPPPPQVYYAPPPPPPYSDPGLAMFNFWAGIITRGVNCMPRYVGVDRWGRPVYSPVC